MAEEKIRPGSLVLYKNQPAKVAQVGDKLEIELEGEGSLKVRPKDVTLLHPGALGTLGELRRQVQELAEAAEIQIAWELLNGSAANLRELAELVYGAYTPASAWAAWEQVAQGRLFRGTPEAIEAVSVEEVAREEAARQARAAEEQAWTGFLERVRAGHFGPGDERYLRGVVDLAFGRREDSRVLHALGRAETPETAHALLLEMHYWDETLDPYPARFGLPALPPQVAIPPLPQEPRRDLTHLQAFAIDDVGNQDPDDALSLEETPTCLRLWVHVADVAALVPPGSPADLEARGRGASLYLPEGTAPMLPFTAAEILGLGLQPVSPALSFGIDLDEGGRAQGLEITPSWVKVERLTYAEAETRLEEPLFQRLETIARQSLARRQENGALFIDLPEVIVRVEASEVIIRPVLPLRSRVIVREAMLAAGEAAANFALANGIPFPFATQEATSPAERPEITAPLPPDDLAGMFAQRKGLKRSQVNIQPSPHSGLGLPVYTRATSPLRRYMDLVAHQQLRAFLSGQPLLDEQALLERVGASEAVTGSVAAAESRARRHWTLVYWLRRPGWRGEAVVVDKRYAKARVIIPELAFETSLHLRGDPPMNTRVPVILKGINLPELEAYFQQA